MKRIYKATAIFWACILSTQALFAEGFLCKVYPADNEAYVEAALPRLKKTSESVHVIMYMASYYPRYPDSPTNLIIRELVKSKMRGVQLEVILNRSDREYAEYATGENIKTAEFLAGKGVHVYLDSKSKATHCKLVVIDRKTVLIGSANWTYSAATKNNETSLVIESEELAEHYIKYFEKIKKECVPFSKTVPASPR